MTARPHPLGIASHPAWAEVERRRHALRVADRKRRIVTPKTPLSVALRRWLSEFFA